MAYVFSGINQALAGKTDEENKQDIFNTAPAVTGDGADGQPANAGEMKTSTEGELGDTGAAAANAATSEQDPQQVNVSNAEVVTRNVDKAKAPKSIDRVKSQLDEAEAGVQSEADNYIKDYSNRDYGLDHGVIDKAVGGDDAAYQTAAQRLALNPTKADAFDAKTDYNVEDTNLLRNDAGMQELLRRDSDANYNGGESAFDMMLLRRNKDFNTLRDNLVTRQNKLRGTVDDYRTSKTDEANKITDDRFGAATNDIKGYLDTTQGGMTEGWKKQVADEQAARAALRAQGGDKDFIAAQSKAAIDGLVAEYQQTGDPAALAQIKYLQNAGVDASNFYGMGRDLDANKDYGLVADEAGASKFNRIMALLGRGDSMQAGSGLGERQGFDTAAYRDAVVQAATANKSKQDAADAEAKRVADAIAGMNAAAEHAAASAKAKADADAAAAAAAAANRPGAGKQQDPGLPGPKGDLNPSGGFVGTGDKPASGATTGAKGQVGEQVVKEGNKQVSNTKKEASKKKEQVKSWCFPAGVCFRMQDGMPVAIEDIDVGDELEQGGTVTHVHRGESDHLFYLNGALVTGGHPVQLGGKWMLAADAPGALPVPGQFDVYSVTCLDHKMVHENGTVFGDYELDDILKIAG